MTLVLWIINFMPWLNYIESIQQPTGAARATMSESMKQRRGAPIRVVAGPKAGWSGWHDKTLGQKKTRYYVILVDPDDEMENLQPCYLEKWSFVEDKPPTTRTEAAMAQYPCLEIEMEKLAKLLAQLKIDPSGSEFTSLMFDKVEKAKKYHKKKFNGFLPVSFNSSSMAD